MARRLLRRALRRVAVVMRALIGSDREPTSWLPDDRDVEHVKALAALIGKFMVATDSEMDINAAVTEARDLIENQEARRAWLDLLSNLPVARRPGLDPNFLIGSTHGSADPRRVDVDRLLVSQVVWKVLERFEDTRTLGRSRAEVFDEYLGPLVATAQSVVILDRWVLRDLKSKGARSGTAWLLRRVLDSGLGRIDILTCSERETANDLGDLLQASVGDLGSHDVKVFVASEARVGNLAHDRHLRFGYGPRRRGSCVSLGTGTQLFAKDPIPDAFSVLRESPRAAGDRENLIRHAPGATSWSSLGLTNHESLNSA